MPKIKDIPLTNNAVIYARFSSHSQKEESIEQQVAECKIFAKQQGLEITEIYADAAISGRTDNRSQFQRLQRDAKKGKFTNIIAYKSNRIARNMVNALTFENEMEKLGIKLFYAREEFGNNAAGRFALRMMMNVNQFYSENLAEDVRRGMEDNAMSCKCNGMCPFGYKRGDEGKPVPDENLAPIVQEIFTRVACGEQFIRIAEDLNARGYKTTFGNAWNKGSFHTILRNERYTGVYIYDNIRIENGIQPIISKELFMKVQHRLSAKPNPQGRHRATGDYILSGKLFCGECGRHMVGISGTGKSGTLHHYYGCQGKKLKPKCPKRNVRRDEIELEVARIVQSYILNGDVIQWMADILVQYQETHNKSGEMALLESRLKEVQKSLHNVMVAIEQGIITETTKERVMELEAEQSKLKGQIMLVQSETIDVSKDELVGWLASFSDGDITDKGFQKRLFDTFLQAVYLFDDGRVRIVFNAYGRKDSILDTTLDFSDDNAVSQAEKCSYKVMSGVP